jgi:glycosyltransferase 2 family protein
MTQTPRTTLDRARPSGPARPARRLVQILTWFACAVILALVIRALVFQFKQLNWSDVRFRPIPATVAVLSVLGVSAMQLLARWTLLLAYGYRLPWRVQVAAAWVPQLGKYVPGGIASVGGAVLLLRKYGVGGAVALSVTILIDAMAVIAGLIVSTPLLLSEAVRARIPFGWLVCAVLTIVGIIVLHPRVFVGLLNWMLVKIRRQPVADVPPARRYAWPVIISFGQWLLAGLALWCMTASIADLSVKSLPLFIASAALAMTVSYLMPFTPGGIGIREGLYLLTLGPIVGPKAAIVVVAMRVMQTIVEIVLAAFGVVALKTARMIE